MSDDGNVEYNIRAELHDPMDEHDMGGRQAYNTGIFSYRIEESLADNMYNLSMEADNDDDVDLTPTPSSRPPPEPFVINDYSGDDPSDMENMTTLAVIGNMIENHSPDYPDVRVLMKCMEPGFFKYGTVLAELEKWSWNAEDYLDENNFSSMDADSSYSP